MHVVDIQLLAKNTKKLDTKNIREKTSQTTSFKVRFTMIDCERSENFPALKELSQNTIALVLSKSSGRNKTSEYIHMVNLNESMSALNLHHQRLKR